MRLWDALDSWPGAVVLAVAAHAMVGALPYAPGDLEAPQEFVEFELVDAPPALPAPKPPPPPPPELPPGPKNPDPDADPTKTSAISNRPEPNDEPPQPVPLRTGLDLDPSQLVPGGMDVRVGNTTTPGFDADVAPGDLRGFAGGGAGGGGTDGPAQIEPDHRAELVRRFQPRYPPELVVQRVEGRVVLEVEVLPTGRAGRVSVKKSVHPELDRVAMQAMDRFRWRAARHDGQRVASTVRIVVVFTIDR